MQTLNEAHESCVDGDRILRIQGELKGYWYEDHVLDYVSKHGNDDIWITDETDEMVTVVIVHRKEEKG